MCAASLLALLALSTAEVRPMPKAEVLPEKDTRAKIRTTDTPCALAAYK